MSISLNPLLQTEPAECSLACLAMIADHHGLRLDMASLRQKFSLSLKGATLARVIGYVQCGLIEPGQAVKLRYAAYPYQKFGQHQGTVTSVDKNPLRPARAARAGGGGAAKRQQPDHARGHLPHYRATGAANHRGLRQAAGTQTGHAGGGRHHPAHPAHC
jgi:hypothetical protein